MINICNICSSECIQTITPQNTTLYFCDNYSCIKKGKQNGNEAE